MRVVRGEQALDPGQLLLAGHLRASLVVQKVALGCFPALCISSALPMDGIKYINHVKLSPKNILIILH